VVSVSNGYDAKGLLKQALRYENDPVMFMESEQMYAIKAKYLKKNIILNWARQM
jgi:pyruvate dehydrogenase E1 component beta subunit